MNLFIEVIMIDTEIYSKINDMEHTICEQNKMIDNLKISIRELKNSYNNLENLLKVMIAEQV